MAKGASVSVTNLTHTYSLFSSSPKVQDIFQNVFLGWISCRLLMVNFLTKFEKFWKKKHFQEKTPLFSEQFRAIVYFEWSPSAIKHFFAYFIFFLGCVSEPKDCPFVKMNVSASSPRGNWLPGFSRTRAPKQPVDHKKAKESSCTCCCCWETLLKLQVGRL